MIRERKSKPAGMPTQRLVRLWVRYALTYILVMAIPFTVFSILITHSVNETARKEIRAEMNQILEKWREAFEMKIEQMSSISLQLSRLPAFQQSSLRNYSYADRMEICRILAVFCQTGLGYRDIAYYNRKLPDIVFTSAGTYQTADYRTMVMDGRNLTLKELPDRALNRTWYTPDENCPGATGKGGCLIRILPLGEQPGAFLLFEISAADIARMIPSMADEGSVSVLDGEKTLYPFSIAETREDRFTLSVTDRLSGLTYSYASGMETPGTGAGHTLMVYMALISLIGIVCLAAVAVISRYHARPIEHLMRMTDDYVPENIRGMARLEEAMNQLDAFSKQADTLRNEVQRRKVLTALIRGKYVNEEQAEAKLKELGMSFRYPWRVVVLLKQELPMEEEEPESIYEPLSRDFDVYGFSYAMRSMYVLLLGLPAENRKPLTDLLSLMAESAEIADADSRFAVSRTFTGLTGAGAAYMEALDTLHTMTEEKVRACADNAGENGFDPEEELEALGAALNQQDRNRIGFLYDVLMNIAVKNRGDWLYTVTLLSRMIYLYLDAFAVKGTEQSKPAVNDPEDMFEYLRQLHERLMAELKTQEMNGTGTEIRDVANYISSCEELDKLTVSSVAEKFGMSPSSLSHRFKARMNCNISDYIFTCKMNHACALLRSTDMTVTEIAGRVGYIQYTSFVRQFKRECGVTPSVYRDAWRGGNGMEHSERIETGNKQKEERNHEEY